jgi:hypothetical protein
MSYPRRIRSRKGHSKLGEELLYMSARAVPPALSSSTADLTGSLGSIPLDLGFTNLRDYIFLAGGKHEVPRFVLRSNALARHAKALDNASGCVSATPGHTMLPTPIQDKVLMPISLNRERREFITLLGAATWPLATGGARRKDVNLSPHGNVMML